MRKSNGPLVALLLTVAGFPACGGSQNPTEAPAGSESKPPPAADPSPSSSDGAPARPGLTAEACEASGGTVVGDIGDGATLRADYRCPGGAAPSGNIRAPEGGPMGVEGSVCCPK